MSHSTKSVLQLYSSYFPSNEVFACSDRGCGVAPGGYAVPAVVVCTRHHDLAVVRPLKIIFRPPNTKTLRLSLIVLCRIRAWWGTASAHIMISFLLQLLLIQKDSDLHLCMPSGKSNEATFIGSHQGLRVMSSTFWLYQHQSQQRMKKGPNLEQLLLLAPSWHAGRRAALQRRSCCWNTTADSLETFRHRSIMVTSHEYLLGNSLALCPSLPKIFLFVHH